MHQCIRMLLNTHNFWQSIRKEKKENFNHGQFNPSREEIQEEEKGTKKIHSSAKASEDGEQGWPKRNGTPIFPRKWQMVCCSLFIYKHGAHFPSDRPHQLKTNDQQPTQKQKNRKKEIMIKNANEGNEPNSIPKKKEMVRNRLKWKQWQSSPFFHYVLPHKRLLTSATALVITI